MVDQLSKLMDREAIIDTINRLFISTDKRDWSAVRDCFAIEVYFDMASAGGGEPAWLPSKQITDAWEQGLKGLKAIHHQAGNHLIEVRGEEADGFCYGIASHYLPGDAKGETRVFVGSYDFHLKKEKGRWRIDRFRFNLKYVDGNLDLGKSTSSE